MNSVIYYSCTNTSKKIAEYLADLLDFKLVNIETLAKDITLDKLVLVFPVHSQNIPSVVLQNIKKISAKYIFPVATYGKMSYGNVLYELSKKINACVIGGVYVPTKHSYVIDDTEFNDYEKLNFIKTRFQELQGVVIPRSFKNPLASFFPRLRSVIGVTLIKKTCSECMLCERVCTSKKCIRCLKCVYCCPQGALSFKLHPFLQLYLKKKRKNIFLSY